MSLKWSGQVPELSAAQHDFLRVMRAAVNDRPCEPPPAVWEPVLRLAYAHQVADFLYPRVRAWPLPLQPPPTMMAHWRIAFFGAVARYERTTAQTHKILVALHQAGVRAIPLKGIWLAGRVYDNGACRPMNDIDLLVKLRDLARARAAIEQLGYATDDFSPEATGGKHLRFHKSGAPLPLELHWRLWQLRGNDAGTDSAHECVWKGMDDAELFGVPVSVFPIERELVYLAYHILRHNWAVPLRAYLDLALLCARFGPQMDAVRLAREADAWQIPFGARFVAQVAADLFGAVPFAPLAPLLQEAAACVVPRHAALAAAVQLSRGSMQTTPALAASLRGSRCCRVVAGLGRVWLAPAEIRLVYPRVVRHWGLTGGYFWRVLDLLRRHGTTMLGSRCATKEAAADTANFALRRTLGHWINARDESSLSACVPAQTGVSSAIQLC